jgi:hypothetical protein
MFEIIEDPKLKVYEDRYEHLSVEPLRVELKLISQMALYHPLTLDGLLSQSVVSEATKGEGLPDSAIPYRIPLPLRCLWRQPGSDLPLWATTGFQPLDENRIVSDYWHKRGPRPEMVRRRGERPWNVRLTQGQYKEYRIPLPRQTSLRWAATCEGNRAEVTRLLEKMAVVGKKRSQGRGVVREWRLSPAAKFSLYDEAGRLLRPVPAEWLTNEKIPLDMDMMSWGGWTPPYWHAACQTLCLV